jgi:hypothetical protein
MQRFGIKGNSSLFRRKIYLSFADTGELFNITLDIHGAIGTGHAGDGYGYFQITHVVQSSRMFIPSTSY